MVPSHYIDITAGNPLAKINSLTTMKGQVRCVFYTFLRQQLPVRSQTKNYSLGVSGTKYARPI